MIGLRTSKNIKLISLLALVALTVGAILVFQPFGFASRTDGRLVYGQSANATPRTRLYDEGAGTFGAAGATVAAATTITWNKIMAAPTRLENIAGFLTSTANTLYIQHWDGSAWSAEWNVATPANTMRNFDITYENVSGDAMVVYTDSAYAGNLRYRVWNGTTWTAAANVLTAAESGNIGWVDVVSRPGSDEITLVYAWSDGGGGYSMRAITWNGTTNTWDYTNRSSALETNLAYHTAAGDTKSFDVAYENSGDVMIVWGYDTPAATPYAYYATKPAANGTSWTGVAPANMGTWADEATYVDIAAEPGGDRIIAVSASSSAQDLQYGTWDGSTTWTNTANVDTAMATVVAGWSPVAVEWVTGGASPVALMVYANATTGQISYRRWTGSWQALQTYAQAGMGTSNNIDITKQPGESEVMVTIGDSNSDLYAKTFDGTNWGNADGGAAMETNLGGAAYQRFDYAYDRYARTTIGNGSALSNQTVGGGATNVVIDSFALNTNTGVDTVTSLTFTGSANFTSTNVTNVRLFLDSNADGVPDNWATPISTVAAPTGTTVNFTGLSLNTTKTSTQYLVAFDVAATAVNVTIASPSVITAALATNTIINNDTTSAAITIELTPPGTVTGFLAGDGADGQSSLSWTNPTDGDFAGVRIMRRSDGTYPTGPSDPLATMVFEDTTTPIATNYTNIGLTNGTTYHYAAFTRDTAGNWNTTVTAGVTADTGTPGPTVTVTSPNLAGGNVYTGETNVEIQRLAMSTNFATASLNSITVNRTGTTDADIATGGVKIYTDGGTLGVIDGADSQIGSGTFSAGSVNISVTAQTIGTTASNFLVVYDIAVSATPGNTTGSSIVNSSSVGVTGAYQVTLSPGAPLSSSSFTITAPTITFSGNVQLGGATVYQGQTNKAMMKFTAQTNAGATTWNTVKLDEYGSGTVTTNASAVKLYRDANGNGIFDFGTDTNIPMTPSTFSAESTTFTLTGGEQLTTTPKTYFIVYDIAQGAQIGQTVGAQMVDNTYIGVTAGNVSGISNYNSGTPTIQEDVVTVTGTGSAPAAVSQSQNGVKMMDLTMSTNYGTASMTGIRINEYGSGTASTNVAAAKIYRDKWTAEGGTSEGSLGADDVLLTSSPATFTGETTDFTFTGENITTTPRKYFIVYDISGTATVGVTVGAELTNATFVTVGSPATVNLAGPLQSGLSQIQNIQVIVTSEPVARGSITATSTSGQDYVVMQAITLKTTTGSTTWSGFVLDEYGSGTATANVANVYLVKETNSKAGYQGLDSPLPLASLDTTIAISPATYQGPGETQTFTLSTPETINTTGATYYIVYSIKGGAPIGSSVGSRLTNQTAITVGGSYTVYPFTNLQSNLLTIVSTPHSGFSTTTNLCETCHSVHTAPDFSNETTLPAGNATGISTNRILNRAYLESPDVVNNYDHKTFNLLCEACHDGTGASKNIKADYEPDADPAKDTEGHQTWRESTQTIGWHAPPVGKKYNKNSKIPCMVCHDAHGSTKNNHAMLSDGLVDYETGIGWTKTSIGDNDDKCLVCHERSGDTQRNSIVMGISLKISNTSQNHALITGCTGCHSKPHNPKAGESSGFIQCGGCHKSIFDSMNGAAPIGYHHYMASADAPVDHNSYPTSIATRTCAICHVDHDIFSPTFNPGNGTRAKNLRTDIGIQPTLTTGFTNLDFDNALTNGGVCVSCHRTAQNKDTNAAHAKQDGSSQTPVLDKASFNSSYHNYTAIAGSGGNPTSTFNSDNSIFTANCSKCHNDTTSATYQKMNPGRKFALHDSSLRHILTDNGTAVGGTNTLDLRAETTYNGMEENFCYLCHSGGSVQGYDIYGKVNMSANAKDVKDRFAAGITQKHLISDAGMVGRHKADEQASAVAGSWNQNTNNTRHVECEDCHNPHAAQNGVSPAPGATIGTVLLGAWGIYPGATFKTSGFLATDWPAAWTAPATWSKGTLVSTNEEWQLCLKCHSNFAYGASPPTGAQTPSAQAETNQSLEFNPNNLGGHAVAGAKTASNQTDGGTFIAPWTTSSRMTCSDCHTNNTGTARGPHGSANKWILKAAYDPAGTTFTSATNSSAALCFLCHDFANYVSGGTLTGTAFRDSSKNLHTDTIHRSGGTQRGHTFNCATCHGAVPHGSAKRHLIFYYIDAQPYWNGLSNQTARPQVGAYTHAAPGSYGEGSCSIWKKGTYTSGCYGGHAAGP